MFLGRALTFVGRYQDAVANFQKALTINPDNLEALAFMGGDESGRGRPAGRSEDYEASDRCGE
jgi:tetratricopeptide (TPR) repeat protein